MSGCRDSGAANRSGTRRKRQGLTANIFMWPGSEVPIDGHQATVWTPYSSKPTYYQRADWVIEAMTRPEAEIPELVMWYFEEPDATMHTYGPDSPQAVAQAEHIDSVLRYFFREIRRSPVFERINFIVTADHGMAALSPERYINLMPLLDTTQVIRTVPGTPFGLEVKEEYADTAIRILLQDGAHEGLAARADAPAFPLRHPPYPPDEHHRHPRDRMDARLRGRNTPRPQTRAHGFDNRDRDMHMVFYASGPAFPQGATGRARSRTRTCTSSCAGCWASSPPPTTGSGKM
ncbi:MAG: alkaline phosphatase family protein [Alistipes onderdonkii]